MKKCYFVIIPLFFLLTVSGQNSTKYGLEEVKNDFRFLYKMLDESHYNLYVNCNKSEYDKTFQKVLKSIKDSMNILQINRLFQPFTALAKHNHCSIEFPGQSYGEYIQQGGTLFPLNLTIAGERVFLTNNYSQDSSITIGDEIISINKRPVKEILSDIYKYYSGENEYLKNSYIEGVYLFPRIFWLVYGKTDNFSLGIKGNSGKIFSVNVKAIPAGEFEEKNALNKPAINPSREFRLMGNSAYLRPGQFMNIEFTGEMLHKAYETGEFRHFIDSSFNEIKNRKITNLIIDLRGNPGGNNSFSDYMISYFADKPFCFYSRFSVRTSSQTKSFWKDINDSTLTLLKEKILTTPNGKIFEDKILFVNPVENIKQFKGNVYVLVDRFTYSNAPLTAALIQDYKFGEIIGEPTADLTATYGSAHQFRLPNTKLLVMYPKAFIVRPNGNSKAEGVIPDFIIKDNVFTDKDEILDYTLELISKK